MLLRKLTQVDIPSLMAIDRVSFAPRDQYGAEFYDAVLSSSAFDAIGVENKTAGVVAWTLLDLTRKPIRIRSLCVRPEFRRSGLAMMLMNAVFEQHAGAIDLLVEPENWPAFALYRKLGFTVGAGDPEMPERVRMVRGDGAG